MQQSTVSTRPLCLRHQNLQPKKQRNTGTKALRHPSQVLRNRRAERKKIPRQLQLRPPLRSNHERKLLQRRPSHHGDSQRAKPVSGVPRRKSSVTRQNRAVINVREACGYVSTRLRGQSSARRTVVSIASSASASAQKRSRLAHTVLESMMTANMQSTVEKAASNAGKTFNDSVAFEGAATIKAVVGTMSSSVRYMAAKAYC